MIPPRVSLDNEIEREPNSIYSARWGPYTTHHASPRFPGWPHGNRTHNGSTSVARKARSRTWGTPLPRTLFAFPIRAPYGLYIRRPFIGNARYLLFCCSLSASRVCAQVSAHYFHGFPPILTVSLITGATRTARVISAYIRTPLFRAIGEQDGGTHHIGKPRRLLLRYPFFLAELQSH